MLVDIITLSIKSFNPPFSALTINKTPVYLREAGVLIFKVVVTGDYLIIYPIRPITPNPL